MTDFLARLLETAGVAVSEPVPGSGFRPTAKYYHAMDFLLYVREDCSYRSDRIDRFLTVLYHPYEETIVGIKLKGFRFLFEQFKRIVKDLTDLNLDDRHFLPVIAFIEVAVVAREAEAILAENMERIKSSYDDARDLVRDVTFDPRDLPRAA